MDAKLDDVVAHSECTDVSAFKTHRLCIIAAELLLQIDAHARVFVGKLMLLLYLEFTFEV